jgi:hypothetical protein
MSCLPLLCHFWSFACHSEHSEESRLSAQAELCEESRNEFLYKFLYLIDIID